MKPTGCSFQVGTIGFISPPIVAQQLSSVFLIFTCGEIEFSIQSPLYLSILYSSTVLSGKLFCLILRPSVMFTTKGSRFKTHTLYLF